jgi:hypothetical protein
MQNAGRSITFPTAALAVDVPPHVIDATPKNPTTAVFNA